MQFLDAILFRLGIWIGLPIVLIVLAVGPARVWQFMTRGWHWLINKRADPESILTEVVRQQEKHVAGVRDVLAKSEAAEGNIDGHIQKSKQNLAMLEKEAAGQAAGGDDLGARASLYKINLERLAIQSFQEQLQKQREHIAESRRRLYLLELQLRQYEVGRTILLSQLAEAKTVEQQYAIASTFDPFHAVANWQKAEGLVQEKAMTARAVEQVYNDTADMPLDGQPIQVDSAILDAQLAALKARVRSLNPSTN